MKPEELRIGNIVSDQNGFEMRVVGLFEDEILLDFEGNEGDVFVFSKKEIELIQPVEITEDRLLNFGFFNPDNKKFDPLCIYSNHFHYYMDSGISYRDFICKPSKGWIIKIGDYDDDLEIKYVHHFQNIYFELTGKILKQK